MATELRQFEIEGRKVWVQVDAGDAPAPTPARKRAAAVHGTFENTSADDGAAARPRSVTAKAVESADIEGALAAVIGPVESALKALKPTELTVELKLGFKVDAGVFIAKTSADASVSIKAVWKPAA